MTIRDRGKIKWLPASFIPIQSKMIREMYMEDVMQNKPEIDVYEIGVLEKNSPCDGVCKYYKCKSMEKRIFPRLSR